MTDIPNFADIERAVEYAAYVLACSKQSPATFVKPSTGSSNKNKSIHQKLTDLYLEETLKEPENEDIVYASHLLAKLAKRERLNCMVLSLYPGNEGYSIMLRSRSGVESETMKLPYEESEILEFIDAAQLPPFLLDLLEKAQMNVFYSGCVVVEIRDYRRSAIGSYDTQYVLLRPSPQSLLRDVTAMSCDGHVWTQDDLFHLESELILATEEPLCLDPSPAVMLVENALQYEEKFLNDPALKRSIKKNSQAAANKRQKLAQAAAPKGMHLYDFITRKREKKPQASSASTALGKCRLTVDPFKKTWQSQLTVPESIDVKKYMKIPEASSTDGMIFVEEHTMERDPMLERHMMAKITIYQPQLGDSYFGEFYLDHDYMPGRSGEEGRRCRFVIGSRQCVNRYLQQFKDLFTEEGKLQVKIAIQKANEPTPTITYTQALNPAAVTGSGVTPAGAPSAVTINNAQALMKQVAANHGGQQVVGKAGEMGTVAGMAAKRNIPIQLSLSISPSSTLTSTHGVLAQNSATIGSAPIPSQFITGSIMATQRIKNPASVQSHHRASSSPLASPATTPKSSTPQQPLSAQASLIAIPKAPTPTPAKTPPPNARTPTPTSATTRRLSATELGQQLLAGGPQQPQQQQPQQQQQLQKQQNLSNFLQGLTSASGPSSSGDAQVTLTPQQQQQAGGIANISVSNLSNLPPNINIQNLTGIPGVNITNLSGLQQMQIAVPVPITMINNNPSLLHAQQGLLGTSSTTASTNAGSFVTMVTALPASTASTCSATTTTSIAISSSGGTSGMLSFPVGLSGLTQLMPVASKNPGGQTIRHPAGMPLLQLQGQQGIQLLSLQQQRGQLKAGNLQVPSSSAQAGVTRIAQGAATTVPLSTVLTSQQMTALGVGGKPGQQLIQLTGGTSNPLGQGGPQQLATHVTFQKGGQPGTSQTLQFHSVQLKPGTATLAQHQVPGGKSKSKKRTTPTPPK